MLSSKILRWFLVTSLLLGLADSGYAMSRPPSKPVLMEFVRVVYEKDAGAIITEWIVPNIDAIEGLARIELLISQADNGAKFGVIIDPASDDRSIKNVSSAGFNVQWDQVSPNGTLLKQSAAGVTGGNLGIGVWVAPQDWSPGRYVIKTRAVRRKHSPAAWQKLATFDYSGKGVSSVMQNRCLVKLIFFILPWKKGSKPNDDINSVTLIRYDKQPQDEGVTMKRWAGDTSGQYKYVVKEKRELKLSDLAKGLIPIEPGIYQFNHNSVYGQPPSGFYGESHFFEIKPGHKSLEVQILLNAAI